MWCAAPPVADDADAADLLNGALGRAAGFGVRPAVDAGGTGRHGCLAPWQADRSNLAKAKG